MGSKQLSTDELASNHALLHVSFRHAAEIQAMHDVDFSFNIAEPTLRFEAASRVVADLDGIVLDFMSCKKWFMYRHQNSKQSSERANDLQHTSLAGSAPLIFSLDALIAYRKHAFETKIASAVGVTFPNGCGHIVAELACDGVREFLLKHLRNIWVAAQEFDMKSLGSQRNSSTDVVQVSSKALEMSLLSSGTSSADVLRGCAALQLPSSSDTASAQSLQAYLSTFHEVLQQQAWLTWKDLRDYFLCNKTAGFGAFTVHRDVTITNALLPQPASIGASLVQLVVHHLTKSILLLSGDGILTCFDSESLVKRFSRNLEIQFFRGHGVAAKHESDFLSVSESSPFVAVNTSRSQYGNDGVVGARVLVVDLVSGATIHSVLLVPDSARELKQIARLELLTNANVIICTFEHSTSVWIFNATTSDCLAELPLPPNPGESYFDSALPPFFCYIPSRQWVVVGSTASSTCYIWGVASGVMTSPQSAVDTHGGSSITWPLEESDDILSNLFRLVDIILTGSLVQAQSQSRSIAAFVQFVWDSFASTAPISAGSVTVATFQDICHTWCRSALSSCANSGASPEIAMRVTALVDLISKKVCVLFAASDTRRINFGCLVHSFASYLRCNRGVVRGMFDDSLGNFGCLEFILQGNTTPITACAILPCTGLLLTASKLAGEIILWRACGGSFLAIEHNTSPSISVDEEHGFKGRFGLSTGGAVKSMEAIHRITFQTSAHASSIRMKRHPLKQAGSHVRNKKSDGSEDDSQAARCLSIFATPQSSAYLPDFHVGPDVNFPTADPSTATAQSVRLGPVHRFVLFCMRQGDIWPIEVSEFSRQFIEVANGNRCACVALLGSNTQFDSASTLREPPMKSTACHSFTKDGVDILVKLVTQPHIEVARIIFMCFRDATKISALDTLRTVVSRLSGKQMLFARDRRLIAGAIAPHVAPHQFTVRCRGYDSSEVIGSVCPWVRQKSPTSGPHSPSVSPLGIDVVHMVLQSSLSPGSVFAVGFTVSLGQNRASCSGSTKDKVVALCGQRTQHHVQRALQRWHYRQWTNAIGRWRCLWESQTSKSSDDHMSSQVGSRIPAASELFAKQLCCRRRWLWDYAICTSTVRAYFHKLISLPVSSKQANVEGETATANLLDEVLANAFVAALLKPLLDLLQTHFANLDDGKGSVTKASAPEVLQLMEADLANAFMSTISVPEFVCLVSQHCLLPHHRIESLMHASGGIVQRGKRLDLTDFLNALPLAARAESCEALHADIAYVLAGTCIIAVNCFVYLFNFVTPGEF